MKKILIAILMFCCVPMFARGDEASDTLVNRNVPYSLIYEKIKNYQNLYETDFIDLLDSSGDICNISIKRLAQACANYTKFNNNVTIDVCRNFMTDVIHGVTTPSTADYPFIVTTTSNTTNFKFTISAAGKFIVDCGNGKTPQAIYKPDTDIRTITCNYNTDNAHTIKIGGQATAYSSADAAISFAGNTNLGGIWGSLGAIFPTLDGDSQPTFDSTFEDCSGLTGPIPPGLFAGIKGPPAEWMFYSTFSGCSGLNGPIPEKLFEGIKGPPAEYMFFNTFYGCSGLNGPIPEKLFEGIKGPPAEWMFYSTFRDCSGLDGSIPEKLFKGIKGAPANWMFYSTFSGCSGLNGPIPADLFKGIKGPPAERMFAYTFFGCSELSGEIPKKLFEGIKGKQAEGMFFATFYGCSGLSGEVRPKFFGALNPSLDKDYVDNNIFYGTNVEFKE